MDASLLFSGRHGVPTVSGLGCSKAAIGYWQKKMLMLSRLRHIGKMLLVAVLVISCTSCARWRDAKMVIAEADSLLVHKIVTRDTAALAEVMTKYISLWLNLIK